MLRINQITNCYGLQSISYVLDVSFEKNRIVKNQDIVNLNFVYGVNMSGKSSIVRVFKNLKAGAPIENKRNTDGKPYVDIELNNNKVFYKSGNWHNSESVRDSIFIYDKQFVNENYTTIEQIGYIGKNANEYYNLLNKEKSLKIKASEIKKIAQNISRIENKADFKGFGSTMKFNLLFSSGDVPFNTMLDLYGKTIQDTPFSISEEIYLNNYQLLMFEKIDLSIIDIILDRIESFSISLGEKYKIRSIENLDFYQTVKNYLLNNQIDKCPICLRDFDDCNNRNDIINQIEKEIKAFLNNEVFKSVLSKLRDYSKIESNYIDEFRSVIHRLTSEDNYVSMEEISILKHKVNSFYNEVDRFLVSKALSYYSNALSDYIMTREKKDIIYTQNKEITDSVLLTTFNELLRDSAFPLSNMIEATLDEQEPFIKISIKNSKDSLKDYFTIYASEGEKSLLSILYYFAIMLNTKVSFADIICIIDDPIDSNNNQNKYLIMDFIARNLIKNRLFNIVFTHAAEVVKISRNLCSPNTNIYLLTNEHKNGLFELNRKHYIVFDGLYDFFKDAVINRSTDNIAFKAAALLSILREYINQTKIFSDQLLSISSGGELNNAILYNHISNRAIHFNIADDYMTIEDLVNIYLTYINGFKIPSTTLKDFNKVKGEKVNEYISRRLACKEYEIENLSKNIMLKNLWAAFIRFSMERLVYDFLIKVLKEKEKIDSFLLDYSSSDCYQLGAKIALIEKKYKVHFDSVNLHKWSLIYNYILRNKSIINDYHHLANAYVTPMFEIRIAELEEYNKKLIEISKICLS